MQMKAAPRLEFHSLHPYALMMKGKFPPSHHILLPLLYGNLVFPKISLTKAPESACLVVYFPAVINCSKDIMKVKGHSI